MSDLKPCPFCGGDADIGGDENEEYAVAFCTGCGNATDGYLVDECGAEFASEAWNTRADSNIKRQAITELLALHEQDRAKVNSQCDTLINMSTVEKYLEGLK